MTVFNLKKWQYATVKHVKISGGGGARLAALGLRSGTRVQVLGFSLFKSGVLLSFGEVRVGIRKNLALQIEVEA